MVQFLSIFFYSWISLIFVGIFKSSRFFVSLCISVSHIETLLVFSERKIEINHLIRVNKRYVIKLL